MLVWLASYPRSGNTLLRVVLRQAFGLTSYSLFDDEFSDPKVVELVGHRTHGQRPMAFVRAARDSSAQMLVKTHDLPTAAGDRAIYVVRDGRSATVSFAHYLSRGARSRRDIVEVVLGAGGHAPWSKHVAAWMFGGGDTLVVRYQDLCVADPSAIAAIGAFLGQPVRGSAVVDFDAAHQLAPSFFRRGSDAANIAELVRTCPNLYELVHGAIAARVGYPTGHSFDAAAAQAEIAEWHRRDGLATQAAGAA